MIGKFVFLAALVLAQGKPQVQDKYETNEKSVRCDLCPKDQRHYLLPHEYDCTKFYYCEYGMKWVLPRDCAPGTQFSFKLQVCIHPTRANCTLPGSPTKPTTMTTTSTTTPVPTTTTTTTTSTTQKPITTTSITTASTESDDYLLENGCPADFNVHKLLPHETMCNKFYYCVHGQKVETQCAPGTYFNAELQVCDWPRNVECAGSIGGDGGSGGAGGEDLPNGCPANFSIHKLLPHETNCSKFYYCVFGNKVERECPLNTHFNPTLQVCDWPKNAGCANNDGDNGNNGGGDGGNGGGGSGGGESGGEGSGGGGSGGGGSGGGGSEGGGSGGGGSGGGGSGGGGSCGGGSGDCGTGGGGGENDTGEAGLLPNGCPSDFDIHKLLPHEKDCDKFYYCVFGEKVERTCAPGTHFNPLLQVCDWPRNVDCAGSIGGDGGSGGAGGEDLSNGCPANFSIHKLLPHETNCSKFYYCVFGNKVERECPLNTHFNPTLQVCDWPKNAGCANNDGDNGNNGGGDGGNSGGGSGGAESGGEGSGGGGSEGGGSGGGGSGGGGSGGGGNGGGGSCGGGSGDCGTGGGGGENDTGEVGLLPNGCPSDFDIHKLLPHEKHCDKFYYCVFGEKVERTCAPGTHFNPLLQVCDWPKNAGCANNDGNNGSGSGGGGSAGGESSDNGSGSGGDGENGAGGSGGGGSGGEESAGAGSGAGESCDAGSGNCSTGGIGNENDDVEGGLLPNGCPSDFDIHKLLPHEKDCDKFYYCVFGEKVERTCAPGTHFNPLLQVCDWPKNAGCANNNGDNGSGSGGDGGNGAGGSGGGGSAGGGSGDNGSGSGGDGGNGAGGSGGGGSAGGGSGDNGIGSGGDGGNGAGGSGGGGSGGGESAGAGNGGEESCGAGSGNCSTGGIGNENDEVEGGLLPNGCPSDFDIHKLLPHEKDCDKFYYCVFGEKVERTCAPGTHFNPLLQVCDWPENAGCATNGGGDGGSNGGGGGDGGSGGGGGGGGGSKNKCESGCNVLPWPHENDCDKFWRCDGSTAVLVVCSEGLHFNPKTLTCDLICNVSCSRRGVESTALADGLKVFLPWDKMDSRLARMYLNNNMNL